jgi:transcriptional regulator with XRE-family HTH domain
VISATEALDNYGLEVLEDVIEYGTALLLKEPNAAGNAIRLQRESLGLTSDQVARYTGLDAADIEHIENSSGRDRLRVQDLERVAFKLGLNEAQLAYQGLARDSAVAARLKRMRSSNETCKLSPMSVVTFTEAASIIRVQHWLMNVLGTDSTLRAKFIPDDYYGNRESPAWRVGQDLSETARNILGIGSLPVDSMRELVEDRLCIPVIQAELHQGAIAGATIAVADGDRTLRGIVLNMKGDNENPLVRRATIAHEIAHLLFDPDEYLNTVRVDTYQGLTVYPQDASDLADSEDYRIEQRANSFAISFLAPTEEVRSLASLPLSGEDVNSVVSKFGISVTAASFHVANANYQHGHYFQDVVPDDGEDWKGRENFAVDYFPILSTPVTRRGRFARLVVEAYEEGLISAESAAEYLCCTTDEFGSRSGEIGSMNDC